MFQIKALKNTYTYVVNQKLYNDKAHFISVSLLVCNISVTLSFSVIALFSEQKRF
jgi:hypothetical protein